MPEAGLDPTPRIPVTVELARAIAPGEAARQVIEAQLPGRVEQTIGSLAGALGVPGAVTAEVVWAEPGSLGGGRFLGVVVNGERCLYSEESVHRSAAYVRRQYDSAPDTLKTLERWCSGLELDGDGARPTLVEFLALSTRAIDEAHPAGLLGPEQFSAYVSTVLEARSSADQATLPADLMDRLRALLDLKISIGDHAAVEGAVTAAGGSLDDEGLEDLVTELVPNVVEIRLPSRYLEDLTSTQGEDDQAIFDFLRDGLFLELGVEFPPFRFVPDDALKPLSFSFTINHVALVPYLGLRMDQCLVNDVPESKDLAGIEVQATIPNPATGKTSSIIPLAAREAAEKAELTTWNALEFLILSLAAELRQNVACFIDRVGVEAQLTRLRDVFPELSAVADSRLEPRMLARTTRALVAEQVSVRNLRALLEELLTAKAGGVQTDSTAPLAPTTGGPLGELPPETLGRLALRREIQQKAARDTSTVVVYLLEPSLEERAVAWARGAESGHNGDEPREAAADVVREAVRRELTWLREHVPTARTPALLTTLAARAPLRAILAPEFPRLTVLAHEELVDANVQPVARIS